MNYLRGMLATREDTMIGNDLIAEIPWIIFGVLLAVTCVRLCWVRRFCGQQEDLESRQPPEGSGDSSAHHRHSRKVRQFAGHFACYAPATAQISSPEGQCHDRSRRRPGTRA